MEIKQIQPDDLDSLLALNKALVEKSGKNGNPIYSPVENPELRDHSKVRKYRLKSWATPIGQVGWGRSLGIYGENGELQGEAELFHRHPLESSLHRVELGMGLAQSIHNLGWGTKLLAHTIDWCTTKSCLQWIDLGVFSSNSPAIHLYSKLGFVEQGRTPDAFRVFGQQIEDLRMSLDLDSRR